MKNKKKKENVDKGITLIALVITIIVLLILASVSISTLTGENGILTKASDAKRDTEREVAKEKVQMAVLASYGTNGKIDVNQLNKNLAKVEGIKNFNGDITEEKLEKGVIVIVDSYEVTIYGTGMVTVEKGNIPIPPEEPSIDFEQIKNDLKNNPSKYLQQAQALGQTTTDDVAIGTDGKVVNLDLWKYFLTNDGKSITLGKLDVCDGDWGYQGNYNDGRIQGTVPQYIYRSDKQEILEVTNMDSCFSDRSYVPFHRGELKYAPDLPETVVSFGVYNNSVGSHGTFWCCINLQKVVLPSSLRVIGSNSFHSCSSLTEILIPNSVTTIGREAFITCTSLTEIIIPSSVVNVGENIFRNWRESQTIHVPFKEGQKPSGWSNDWDSGCSANIVYAK